jgi:hypothetical protein
LFVLSIKVLHVLCQKRLLFTWFFQVVVDELIKGIDGDQSAALQVKLFLTHSRNQNSFNHLKYDIEIKPHEHQFKVLFKEFFKDQVNFQIKLFKIFQFVQILVQYRLNCHLTQLIESLVVVVFTNGKVDVISGDTFF